MYLFYNPNGINIFPRIFIPLILNFKIEQAEDPGQRSNNNSFRHIFLLSGARAQPLNRFGSSGMHLTPLWIRPVKDNTKQLGKKYKVSLAQHFPTLERSPIRHISET